MSTTQELSQETIREFVIAAHGDLEEVKRLLAEEPALLDARYMEFNETALEAASHTGRRNIVEYLLAEGTEYTITAAAMLGKIEDVEKFLKADPGQAYATGSHGFPLLFFVGISGDTRIADLLVAHGGGEGRDVALSAAAHNGNREMAEWLLGRGADVKTKDFMGKTTLEVAEERGDAEMADLLRRHGAGE